MPEYKEKQKKRTEEPTQEEQPEVEENVVSAEAEDVLDLIDEVLGDITEEEAALFIAQYINKGGE